MKKVTLLLLILFLVMGASGGYGYYILVLEDEENSDDDIGPNNAPSAVISPRSSKIQVNESITFSAAASSDSDNDKLTYTWTFEGDNEKYNGETVVRNYPEGGDFYVNLLVRDSGGLTDVAEATVIVVEDYYDEVVGDVQEGQIDQIEFPVQDGVVSVYITWDLNDNSFTDCANPQDPCTVDLVLNDSNGKVLANESDEQEGQGSWSISSDILDSFGNYEVIIEGKNGDMEYNPITIDVSYT